MSVRTRGGSEMKSEVFCRQCVGKCVPADCMAIKQRIEMRRAMEIRT